jgi:hypothetical protein
MNRTITVLAAALLLPATARATPEWLDKISFSGWAQSDLRFNVDNYRGVKDGDGYKFSTNRNDLDLRLEITPIEQLAAVVDARLRYFGFQEVTQLVQTTDRNKVDPFNVDLDQAYLSVRGVPFKWLDIKAGRMVQTWGSADVFAPTDNISARDFSDPMDFARKVPNQMLEVDMYPTDWLTLNVVWVPVFKPAQLPPSTSFGFAVERDSNGCLLSSPPAPLTKENAAALAKSFAGVDPCMLNFKDPVVNTVMPQTRFADSQVGVRAKFKIASEFDVTLSYYYGRFTFPVALDAVAITTPSATNPSKLDINYVAEVMYPRMQVLGLDFSYTAPWLDDIQVIGEMAVIFPEEVDFALRAYSGSTKVLDLANANVPSTPFIKATVGLEYRFTKWLMVNGMYVRGFFDEFNDIYGLHNYITLTPRLNFLGDTLNIQIATMLDLNDLSNYYSPTLTWVAVPGVEFTLGAWVYGGSTHPKDPLDYASKLKFGQKATGRSVAFLKTKVSW